MILENDIDTLAKKMRGNKEVKEKLTDELGSTPSEIGRMKFIQKISSIHEKLKKSKSDLENSKKDIE